MTILTLLACKHAAEAPPPDRTLTSDTLTVTVTADPFGVEVADADGVVLATEPDALEFAPIGEDWTTIGSPGWYGLELWGETWSTPGAVVDTEKSGDTVTVTFEDGTVATVTLTDTTLRFDAESADSKATYGRWRFQSPETEEFLGLGERFTRTAFRGAQIYSWCEEGGVGAGEGSDTLGPNGESMTYFPVPWFLSTEGYGFWADTTYRTTFDFAAAEAGVWELQVAEPKVSFELYVDPDPYARIDAFTARTGRPALPAPWAFGPRRRIGRGNTVGGVSEIQAMRDNDLAITAADDALHFLPALSQTGIEDELLAWTADQHSLGYKAIGYYNGLVSVDDPNAAEVYAEGVENGYFILGPDGEPSIVWLISGSGQQVAQVDFSNPDAVAWYQGLLRWGLDLGYDGWMYDFGEYVQPDDLAFDGRDGRAFHNALPPLYQRAAHELLEAERPRDYLFFARSGYTGSQAVTPVFWSGDPAASFESTDGLPSMVRASLNLGLSGVPFWGGDIGGFHCVMDGVPEPELITRWIEQGSMSPIMQDQDACNGADGDKPGIWDDSDTFVAWQTYARLHTRLFPYLWALAQEATATGAPLVRHVWLEEGDAAYADEDTAHFLGPALFVAPVLEKGATSREVRFPGGESYLDWDDASVHSGTETVDAPIGKLPLYLRKGHLVALLRDDIDTLAEESDPTIIGPEEAAERLEAKAYLGTGQTVSAELVASSVLATEGTLSVSLVEGSVDVRRLEVVDDLDFCEDDEDCVVFAGGGHLLIAAYGSVELGALTLTAPDVRVWWDIVYETD